MKQKSEVAMYCPVCTRGKVFVAASQEEAERIRLWGPQDAGRASYFAKCQTCKSQVGVEFQGQDSETTPISVIGTVSA